MRNRRNPSMPLPRLRPPPRPWSGGCEIRGDGFGRVGVGVIRMGGRGAAIPRASAGADRHGWVSWGSWALGVDERRPALVSSSSCRMMAAASRSTRARYASRCVFDGGPPDRPRFIGPSRVSATWLLSRSSRSVTGTPSRASMAAAHSRVNVACGTLAAGRIERQADDHLADVVLRHDVGDRPGVGVGVSRPSDRR